MTNQNREFDQNLLQNDVQVVYAASDEQSASMTWDIVSCNSSTDELLFGDFFPMQAAG